MKIFKSIKWRLQIWYGFFLAIVLMGFVGVSYQLESDRQYNNIDRELGDHIEQIIDSMKRPPPPRDPNGPPPDDQPPNRPFRPDRQRDGLHLPPRTFGTYFDFAGPKGFYYVIWSPNGEELMHSTNAPSDLTMPLDHIWTRTRGVLREQFNPIPGPRPDYVILVGRSIAPELKELQRMLLKQIAWAGMMLFVGLFTGWLISSRVIKPINDISATAAKISAGDLSQRINVAEAESELGQLAAVLNSTFARLEAAFAQQQQFTSDAAHELRTPVSVMLTQAQTALNRERTAPEYRETVETCQRAAQRMRRLIESLLALARLDAGQEQMKRLQFDFSKTISDCAEMVQPMASERGVKIITELSALEIAGDSERLAQVVTNLLTNAIQYNRRDGEVRVKLESQNGMAILTVSDTGRGIAAEDLPRVFERFYRADKSRSTGGNGLGLAISKAVVEAHGGTIEVASEENDGTTFTVRLPV
jgi:two-component system, OmpR family, sensor kinase